MIAVSLMALALLAACGDDESRNPDEQATGEEGCKEYGDTTKAYCTEAMEGGLDLSCQEAIVGIETARVQLNDNIYEVDDATNAKGANDFCALYLDKLRQRYTAAKAPANVRAQIMPRCVELQAHVMANCIEPLGVEKVDSFCHIWISTVAKSRDADRENSDSSCDSYMNQIEQ